MDVYLLTVLEIIPVTVRIIRIGHLGNLNIII